MQLLSTCPTCGSSVREGYSLSSAAAIDRLTGEVERLCEVAERRSNADAELIKSLTEEVNQLRETVARLRGHSSPASVATAVR
jgi:transcription initiation factor IIE alpha subunit